MLRVFKNFGNEGRAVLSSFVNNAPTKIKSCHSLPLINQAFQVNHISLRYLATQNAAGSEPIDTSNSKTLPLHDAAEKGDYNKIVYLIKQYGVDVDLKDSARGNATALHVASRSGHLDIVEFLSDSGANLNAKGPWDMTPLMYSIIFHRIDVVKYLLECNVDAAVADNRGRTAIMHAVNEKQSEIESLLKRYLQ